MSKVNSKEPFEIEEILDGQLEMAQWEEQLKAFYRLKDALIKRNETFHDGNL